MAEQNRPMRLEGIIWTSTVPNHSRFMRVIQVIFKLVIQNKVVLKFLVVDYVKSLCDLPFPCSSVRNK